MASDYRRQVQSAREHARELFLRASIIDFNGNQLTPEERKQLEDEGIKELKKRIFPGRFGGCFVKTGEKQLTLDQLAQVLIDLKVSDTIHHARLAVYSIEGTELQYDGKVLKFERVQNQQETYRAILKPAY